MVLLAMANSAMAESYADDTWDFSDAEEFIVPEYASDIPRWMIVSYNGEGPYLWNGCELFLEEHPDALSGMTSQDCVDTIAEISGIRNPDWISEGTMVMVPSPNNTSAEIAERRSEFANLPVWARNPMGMTARLAEFNRDIDEHNQRLDEAEGRLDEHDELLSDQAGRLASLENQVATLAQTAGANLSTAEVRAIATEVLEEADIQPGMTESDIQSQIRSALDEQGAEFAQLASDVEVLRQELESIRSAQLSPEEYARTALEIARDVGVSEAQVESVVAQALTELDLVSPTEMSAAIESALTEVQGQVSTLETQVSNLQDELRSLRSETSLSPEAYAEAAIAIARDLGLSETDVDRVVQTALNDLDLVTPDDMSEAINETLDERGYGNRVTAPQEPIVVYGYEIPTWMLWGALTVLGVLTLLLLGLKTFMDRRRSKGFSNRLGSVETKAGEAHELATGAAQAARVAINLGLPDDWQLIGDLPTQDEVKGLDQDQSVTLRFFHETKGERKVIFTMAKGSIQNPDGNMVDGLLVAGISGLVKPIAVNVNNMVGKVRKGINSNKFVGVDAEGKTKGPT